MVFTQLLRMHMGRQRGGGEKCFKHVKLHMHNNRNKGDFLQNIAEKLALLPRDRDAGRENGTQQDALRYLGFK